MKMRTKVRTRTVKTVKDNKQDKMRIQGMMTTTKMEKGRMSLEQRTSTWKIHDIGHSCTTIERKFNAGV